MDLTEIVFEKRWAKIRDLLIWKTHLQESEVATMNGILNFCFSPVKFPR